MDDECPVPLTRKQAEEILNWAAFALDQGQTEKALVSEVAQELEGAFPDIVGDLNMSYVFED